MIIAIIYYSNAPDTILKVMELIAGDLPLGGECEIDVRRKFVLKDALREG